MINDQFKSAMRVLKTVSICLLNEAKDAFKTLDDVTAEKLYSNIEDVLYSLSRASEDINMLEWRVRTENFY